MEAVWRPGYDKIALVLPAEKGQCFVDGISTPKKFSGVIFCQDHRVCLGEYRRWIPRNQRKGKGVKERFIHQGETFIKEFSIGFNGGIFAVHPDGIRDFREILLHGRTHRQSNKSGPASDASVLFVMSRKNAI